MNRNTSRIFLIMLGVTMLGITLVQASQLVDPSQIPLEDNSSFYPTNLISSMTLPAMIPINMVLPDNTTGYVETVVAGAWASPRQFLALESDALDVAHSPIYPDFPQCDVSPLSASVWGKSALTTAFSNITQRAIMAPPGSLVPTAQLPTAGTATQSFSNTPTQTTPLTGTPSTAWDEPVGLYVSYANGLDYLSPSTNSIEGPPLLPDEHVWPLPGDLARSQ